MKKLKMVLPFHCFKDYEKDDNFPLLLSMLCFVDMPGLDSVNEGKEEILIEKLTKR